MNFRIVVWAAATLGFLAQAISALLLGWSSDRWTRSGRDEALCRRWTMVAGGLVSWHGVAFRFPAPKDAPRRERSLRILRPSHAEGDLSQKRPSVLKKQRREAVPGIPASWSG